jgi:hypothetical protein
VPTFAADPQIEILKLKLTTMKLSVSLLAIAVNKVCDCDSICHLCFLATTDTLLSSAADRRPPLLPSPIFVEFMAGEDDRWFLDSTTTDLGFCKYYYAVM